MRKLRAISLVSAPLLITLACGSSGGGGDPTVAGSGTASGSIDGRAYQTVGAAYLIGQPDDPANTTVIYVFDQPISCGDISDPGWDQRVTDQTQSLELKLVGLAAGSYPASGRPGAGESVDNYTLTSTSATPAEQGATAGTVMLDAIAAGASASGRFDLTFAGGSLTGTFDAAFCAGGNEP